MAGADPEARGTTPPPPPSTHTPFTSRPSNTCSCRDTHQEWHFNICPQIPPWVSARCQHIGDGDLPLKETIWGSSIRQQKGHYYSAKRRCTQSGARWRHNNGVGGNIQRKHTSLVSKRWNRYSTTDMLSWRKGRGGCGVGVARFTGGMTHAWSDMDDDCMWLTCWITLEFIAIWGQLRPAPPSCRHSQHDQTETLCVTTDILCGLCFSVPYRHPYVSNMFAAPFCICFVCPTCCENLTAKSTSSSRRLTENNVRKSGVLFPLLYSNWSVTLEHNKLQCS